MKKDLKETLFSCDNLSEGVLNAKHTINFQFSSKVAELNEKEKLEIENIKVKYKEPRNTIVNELEQNKKDLQEYRNLIVKYACFDIEKNFYDIIDIIVEIVSLYKGEDWVYEEYNFENEYYYIIKPKTLKIDTVDELESLSIIGKVLDLTNDITKGIISFYDKTGSSNICVSDRYKNYKYVLNFVDFVVRYRIENKVDEINYLELKKLEQIFIIRNKDNIKQIYSELAQKSRDVLELEISSRERLLENYYNNVDETGNFQNLINSKKTLTDNVLRKIMKETLK